MEKNHRKIKKKKLNRMKRGITFVKESERENKHNMDKT